MGALPEEDPARPGHDPLADGEDDTTTAEKGPPAAPLHARGEDEPSERTLRPSSQIAALPSIGVRRASVPPPVPSTAPKKLAAPIADLTDDLEDDEEEEDDQAGIATLEEPKDDSITTLAPRLSPSAIGIMVPGSVEIRTVEYDDSNDETETEVRTTPGIAASQIPPTLKAASSGSDGVSTSPRPAAGVPASELARSTIPDVDEDVVTQSKPVETYEEDSVTTRAPTVTTAQVEAVIASGGIDMSTASGTTKKIRKQPPAAGRPATESPADSESDSVTTQAPAPLTNILRLIAADGTPATGVHGLSDDEDDDDDDTDNRTEVMPNAPLKRIAENFAATALSPGNLPPIRPTSPLTLPLNGNSAQIAAINGASSAALRAVAPLSGSESGLRAAGHAASGIAPAALPSHLDPRAFAATEQYTGAPSAGRVLTSPAANLPTLPPGTPAHVAGPTQATPASKGPRYGLLVALFAVAAIAIPAAVYAVLLRARDEGSVNQAAPAETQSAFVGRDTTMHGKDTKHPLPSASASASASPSASASHGPVTGRHH